eukprot:6702299-Prymnesium_polylepis.1
MARVDARSEGFCPSLPAELRSRCGTMVFTCRGRPAGRYVLLLVLRFSLDRPSGRGPRGRAGA